MLRTGFLEDKGPDGLQRRNLERLRGELTKELEESRDPLKINDLKIKILKLESELGSGGPAGEVKRDPNLIAHRDRQTKILEEIEKHRAEIRELTAEHNATMTTISEIESQVTREQEEFEYNCRLIASKIMERAGDPSPMYNDEESYSWHKRGAELFKAVSGLSFEAAKAQADEIYNASGRRPRREWVEVVSLPKYKREVRQIVRAEAWR